MANTCLCLGMFAVPETSASLLLPLWMDTGVPQVSWQHPEDTSAVPRHLEHPMPCARPPRRLPRHVPCRRSWWLRHLPLKQLKDTIRAPFVAIKEQGLIKIALRDVLLFSAGGKRRCLSAGQCWPLLPEIKIIKIIGQVALAEQLQHCPGVIWFPCHLTRLSTGL